MKWSYLVLKPEQKEALEFKLETLGVACCCSLVEEWSSLQQWDRRIYSFSFILLALGPFFASPLTFWKWNVRARKNLINSNKILRAKLTSMIQFYVLLINQWNWHGSNSLNWKIKRIVFCYVRSNKIVIQSPLSISRCNPALSSAPMWGPAPDSRLRSDAGQTPGRSNTRYKWEVTICVNIQTIKTKLSGSSYSIRVMKDARKFSTDKKAYSNLKVKIVSRFKIVLSSREKPRGPHPHMAQRRYCQKFVYVSVSFYRCINQEFSPPCW